MKDHAHGFLQSLQPDQREKAVFPFASEERQNWHYIPRPRAGVPLKELTSVQREGADRLLQSVLSVEGLAKAREIMALEEILGKLEENGAHVRDPELYFITIFGLLGEGEPWGWRMEGHHLSLNLSVLDGDILGHTPFFMGANPAEVRSGEHSGKRVLRLEEDLARELLVDLGGEPRRQAVMSGEAPRDIITGADRQVRMQSLEGLPAASMNEHQRKLLANLVDLYMRNLSADLAQSHWSKIRAQGFDKLHFAWAGGAKRREGHYYRVHGPTMLIEYDNTQNDANHIHTVLRDLENDFGEDLLRKHYESGHHH
jgi:hypothetical protein